MDREPQGTRPLGIPGDGSGGTPALRETPPPADALPPGVTLGTQWSAFITRILRPAGSVRRATGNDP